MFASSAIAEDDQEDDFEFPFRLVGGFEQAGAAAADSDQNYFFDFFFSGALSNQESLPWRAGFSYWGNARIASSPQQINAPISEFFPNFAARIGELPVNQMAQSAEFLVGFEKRFGGSCETDSFSLGLVAFYGATGQFSPPEENLRVFRSPRPGDAQFETFSNQILTKFPSAVGRDFIGFTPPGRDQFYRMYGAGFRFNWYRKSLSKKAAPRMLTVTAGQDETITGGRFRGVVGRIDAFTPIRIGKTVDLYLFGTVNLRLGSRSGFRTPLVLEELETVATTTPDGMTITNQIQPFDPRIAIVPLESNRDTYRIGFGFDLGSMIAKWLKAASTKTESNPNPTQ